MRVAIGSDHAGFELKEAVKAFLPPSTTRCSTSAPTAGAGRLSRLRRGGRRRAARASPRRARHHPLRQRRRRLDGAPTGSRHPRRPVPRHLLGAPGRRARRHERARARRPRRRHRAGARADSRVPERALHRRGPPPAPARQDDALENPLRALAGVRPVGLARLHPAQPDHQRRAAAPDRRGRPARRHLQSGDLREGRHRQLRLPATCSEAPEARGAGRRRRSTRGSPSATSRRPPMCCARSTRRPRGATGT